MEQSIVWLGEVIPSILWSVVGWIAFFFKLASLAFIVPTAGLIVFDFCLWLWRLYRPSRPAESPRSSRLARDYVRHPPPGSTSSTKAPSTAIELEENESQPTERRTTYENANG